MRRRLLVAMLLVAGVAVLGFGVPLAVSVQARYQDEARLTLSEEASRAAVAVPGSFARDNDPPELPDPTADIDVALYGTDGRRVVGEGPGRADEPVAEALSGNRSARDPEQLVVAVPISDEETVVGAIRTSMPASVVSARTYRTWAAMAVLAVAVLIGAGALAARRSRSLVSPLARLRDDAEILGAGGTVLAGNPSGVVEIDSVHDALRDAAGRLDDAMTRERALSADLAHQLRTPLASLRIRLESEPMGQDGSGLVDDALRDVDRLEQTIEDLLTLARDAARDHEPWALAIVLQEAAEHWGPRLAVQGRDLSLVLEPHLPWVNVSPAAVRQILDVLVDNGLAHGAGTVTVSASRVGQGAVVAIADRGAASIDPHGVFVRRGPEASGEGIGLALARRLADAEGLRLVVADPGPGVVIHLIFGGTAGTTTSPA